MHRLKLLKRQMYGRASFAVLRQRVLQRDGPAERDWGEPLSYSSRVIPQPGSMGVRKDRKRLEYRC